MVGFAPLLGVAALYAGIARAAPAPDSSYGGSSNYGSSGSSYGGSNYGSSQQDNSYNSNSYGGNQNSYGSNYNGNSYNNGNNYQSSSSMTQQYTSTSSSMYSMPTYGSGSMSWNMGDGYNNCVQQCVASYGGPSATGSWPQETGSSMGSSGSGATHTVIVAPTQGVLRYIPFATNASVGDTIKFIWGAGPHTVTKSSALTPCNKTSDTPFASGMQNKSFVFTQVVNDTNPVFYYCGVPGHCEKGMFGVVNPPSTSNNGNAMQMIPKIAQNYSSTSAAWSYAQNATMNNVGAQNWGWNMDMSQMPQWSMPYMAENILYTRSFLAQNPEVMNSDGSVNLGAIGSNPMMIPNDVAAAAGSNNAAASPSSSSSSSSSASSSGSSTSAPASSGSPVAASSKSGAGSVTASRGAVALIAVAAAFFAL